jgi:hypothetical protein
MTVKGNMPTLFKQLKNPRWRRPGSSSTAPPRSQLRRIVTKSGRKIVEVVYLITSDRHADPATLAAWVRSHWEIENKLHWVRDVTYEEDKSLIRTGTRPALWPRCAAWPSACCACTGTPTSPPPTATTPATRNGRYSCFRPHERLCRVPGWRALKFSLGHICHS